MKFRESLVATLNEERRPSRRMALMAFVRRYSRRDVPVTGWRGTGDTSDAMMSLLSKCGLRDGGAVKLTRSSLDTSAWRLAFTPGDPLAEEFVNCCRDAGVPDRCGNTPIELAMRATYTEGKDLPDAVEAVFPPDRQEEATPAAPDAPSFADGVAKRTAEILRAVAAMPNPLAELPSVNTEIAAARSMAALALNTPNIPAVAPLPVIEAYVRHVMPASDRVPYDDYAGTAPEFSVFPGSYQARLGTPAYVRPVMPGDPDIPLRALTSAPAGYLDGSLGRSEGPFAGSPIEGYLVESLSELAPGETKDAKHLLMIGCAPVVGHDTEAMTRINKSLFIANHPVALWDYVRWLHDCAYKGVARCWLTPHLRVGVPSRPDDPFSLLGDAEYDRLCLRDPASMFCRGSNVVSDRLRSFGAAVFAMVLADPSAGAPASGRGRATAVVHLPPTAVVVGDPPEAPAEHDEDADSDSMYLGKADLPIEWFWMTHSTGVAPDGHEECTDNWGPSERRLQAGTNALRDFRRKAEANPGRTLLPRCSFERSQGMLGRNVDGGVEFHPASAFYSGLIALLRSYAPDMAFREWNGRAPWSWAIHNPGSVLTAAYSGIETDLSPATADEGAFPKMDWCSPSGLRDLLALADASGGRVPPEGSAVGEAIARFTRNIEAMSTTGVGMAEMASRTKGTERTKVLVVETNVDAAAFCRRNTAQEMQEFAAKARELFVQTFGYRNDDVLCIADRTGRMDETRRADPEYRYCLASVVDRHGPSTAGAGSEADFYRRGAPSGFADGTWWVGKVQAGAMVDASGRLYLVFRATGDAGQAMSVGWRHCSRLPVSSATIAAKGGADACCAIGVSPYVSDDLGAIEVSAAVLERRFRLYDRESHMAIAGSHRSEVGAGGRVTPLFMPETMQLPGDETPPREWFQDSRCTPVTELLG